MHNERKKDRRRAVIGTRRGLCALCALLLSAYLVPAYAAEGGAVFLFPFEGFRFEAPQGAQVLTQHNLSEHAGFLAGLGTDEAAVLAAMRGSNAVMAVFPAEGGQLELTLADAEGIAADSSPRMDEETRAALLAAYADMPRYQDVAFSNQRPDWLRMVFSTQQGGLPVFILRYITVAHGQQYLLSSVLIGRAPEEADDVQALDVIDRISFLVAPATPAPTPAPEPTPMPTFTPRPTPGAAERLRQEPDEDVRLSVDPPPAWTDDTSLIITGAVDPQASVRMLLDGEFLTGGRVLPNGEFTVSGELPESGDYEITIEAEMLGGKTASETYTVRKETPQLWLYVTEPTETVTRADSMIRGKTEPDARVNIQGKGLAANVRANSKGDFNFRLRLPNEGEYIFTLTASLKGYESCETTYTVTRVFTRQEALNAFRKSLVPVDYGRLLREPEVYAGKRAGYRSRVAAIGDVDGTPLLLLQTRQQSGRWDQPIWALCDGTLLPTTKGSFLAYVQFTGERMPYTDADGNTADLPVAELRFYTD